jgi:hypothetical protein
VAAAQTDATFRRTAPLNMNQGVNLDTAVATASFPHQSHGYGVARKDRRRCMGRHPEHDLVVRLNVDATGIPSVGTPLVAGAGAIVRVDLQNPGGTLIPGKAPRGIAINKAGTRAFVSNFVSRSVSMLDLSNPDTPTVIATALSSALPAPGSGDEFAQLGAELFYTGRGPNIRMSAEGWGGCIVCHPNGRSDNITGCSMRVRARRSRSTACSIGRFPPTSAS